MTLSPLTTVGARPRVTLVDVCLTDESDETGRAATFVFVVAIHADASIQARVVAGALILVHLAQRAGEACWTVAAESIQLVDAAST